MTISSIPTSSDPFYSQTTNLDGVDYTLDFRYCQREACWYLSIATSAGVSLVDGLKVVSNWNLLRRCSDHRLPAGSLIAVARGVDSSPPGLEDFGKGLRVELLYYSADETPPI